LDDDQDGGLVSVSSGTRSPAVVVVVVVACNTHLIFESGFNGAYYN